MKKLIASMSSVLLIIGIASVNFLCSGCSYFSSAKAPEASADPSTSSDTQVVVQAVEVDAVELVPASTESADQN